MGDPSRVLKRSHPSLWATEQDRLLLQAEAILHLQLCISQISSSELLQLHNSTDFSSLNSCPAPVTPLFFGRSIRHEALLGDPRNLTALMVSMVFFPASPVSPCVSPATYKTHSLQFPPAAAGQMIQTPPASNQGHSLTLSFV